MERNIGFFQTLDKDFVRSMEFAPPILKFVYLLVVNNNEYLSYVVDNNILGMFCLILLKLFTFLINTADKEMYNTSIVFYYPITLIDNGQTNTQTNK